jgi:hypothetical protein
MLRVVPVSIFLEHFYPLTLSVYEHQPAFIAMIDFIYCTILILKDAARRLKSHQLFRQSEFKL